jgi:hypothetical protein
VLVQLGNDEKGKCNNELFSTDIFLFVSTVQNTALQEIQYISTAVCWCVTQSTHVAGINMELGSFPEH